MKILVLLTIVSLSAFILGKCASIDIDDISFSNCTNGSYCDEPIKNDSGLNSTGINTNSFDEYGGSSNATIGNDGTESTNGTTEYTTETQPPAPVTTTSNAQKNHSDICTCDITKSLCDTDCCCDPDCNNTSVPGLKFAPHLQRKIYDSRYCYTKNFIHRNNTQFILERLASNLFCIAYDNLPPIYGVQDVLDIRDRGAFESAKAATNPKKYSWNSNNAVISPPEFNSSSQYGVTDVLWKFQNNIVTSIEFPQAGFTAECKMRKRLKYLEVSKWTCMQTHLSNDNTHLFPEAYINFTVISSPQRFNSSFVFTGMNHSCPKNVCIPVRSLYCSEVDGICRNDSQPSSLEYRCNKTGNCRNVVKRVRYTFVVDGTCGIVKSIEVRFELTNTSRSFHQSFEVAFQSTRGPAINNGLGRSPGYAVGDPIVIGTLVRNNTNNVITEHIEISESGLHLTVASGRYDGGCDSRKRHVVGFGEDTRVGCYVDIKPDKFSSDSCRDLQSQLLKHLLNDSLANVTEIDKYDVYVSKTGDISGLETSNWTQILLDRVARNVITGQTYDRQVRCSGMMTSFSLDILYTVLPTLPGRPDNYKIAAVSLTLSEPIDVYWPKCLEPDCRNLLKIPFLSLVSFVDISTPSMYHYAGGPNLDITLPYDFFYPFMSSADKPGHLLSVALGLIIGFKLFLDYSL